MTKNKKSDGKALKWILGLAVAGLLFVPCIGIVAAIAIPAFVGYLQRSKTAEANSNLRALFEGASAYYEQEHFGPDGQVRTHCLVDAASTPGQPGPTKVVYPPLAPSFEALGFSAADPLYYRYEIHSPGGCGHTAGDPQLYTFRARGDLDGDGRQSTFEIAVGSSRENQMVRAEIDANEPLE
ncbi:MAG: type IV pilin protein [Sandaracinaceae bacterium]